METQFKPIDPAQYAHAYQGIPYCDRDPLQVVDIYVPGDDGDYPLIVYVNGGGWVQQLPRHNTVPGVWAAPSQGYALASVGYRLAPQSHWPAQAHDLKAALRFLRAHAKEYGYNADKITVWGNSAGGHIANMCAATNGVNCSMNIPLGNVGKVLNAFYERCPDVVVNTGYANSGTFKNRGIDMNLFGNRLDIDDPDVVKLGFERYLLVLPKDHPLASRESVSLREVKDDPFVFSEYGTPLFNDVCDMFEAVGGSPNIVATSQVSLDVLSMVSAGVGYCVAPEFSWLVGMEGNFVTVPIQGSQHGRYLYARFNNAYRPSEAALSFANFLQDLVEGVVEVN